MVIFPAFLCLAYNKTILPILDYYGLCSRRDVLGVNIVLTSGLLSCFVSLMPSYNKYVIMLKTGEGILIRIKLKLWNKCVKNIPSVINE